jgi:hypothetical protein
MIMSTIAQNGVPDTHEDSPWPEMAAAPHTARQAWCAKVQAIADRAKATLPACSGRVDAAVRMVLAGDVEILPDGHARVQSQSNGTTLYRLVNGTCDCRDFDHAPSHWCKHRIGAGIAKRAGLSPVMETPTAAAPMQAEPELPTPEAVQRIDPAFVVWISGRPFVRHAGLLKRAHEVGLQSLTVEWTYNDADLSLAHAVAIFTDGRRFEESADSTQDNVGRKVALHWRRMSLTRASARALRLALGCELCSVEELEGD